MSLSIQTAPVADPNFPAPSISSTTPTVPNAGVFTESEVLFLESVLWYYEENCPLARPFENTDPEKDGYDPALAQLTTVRAKLAALRPTVSA